MDTARLTMIAAVVSASIVVVCIIVVVLVVLAYRCRRRKSRRRRHDWLRQQYRAEVGRVLQSLKGRSHRARGSARLRAPQLV